MFVSEVAVFMNSEPPPSPWRLPPPPRSARVAVPSPPVRAPSPPLLGPGIGRCWGSDTFFVLGGVDRVDQVLARRRSVRIAGWIF